MYLKFCIFSPKRGDGDGQGKVKQLPEENPSSDTYQSDMKVAPAQKREIDAQIEDNKTGRKRRKALADLSTRWPGGVVPYVINLDSGKMSTLLLLQTIIGISTCFSCAFCLLIYLYVGVSDFCISFFTYLHLCM